MAYAAVNEFKRLANVKQNFSRRTYTLEEAQQAVIKAFGNREKDNNLILLKETCLENPRSRRELTEIIYNHLIDQGIYVEHIKDLKEVAAALYAEMYGYSIFQPYMDNSDYNEFYFNAHDDCWGIIGLERYKLPIKFRNEEHALNLLMRLTEGSRDGKVANDNRLSSTVLKDRTRIRWSIPAPAEAVSANFRKHSTEDMTRLTGEFLVQDKVMTRKVFSLLSGMAIVGVCYGIIGPGGVGKTALLRSILKEVHEYLHPRFLVSENGSELHLKTYLNLMGYDNVDVLSLQKWSGKGEGLQDIFTNFMQAKGEYLLQPEILMPEEVEITMAAKRRGHLMGPFTAHSYPDKLIGALADLYIQRFPSDRGAVMRTLYDDIQASCYYGIQITDRGKERRVFGVYEYVDQSCKSVFTWNPTSRDYDVSPIKNKELKEKLMQLRFVAPSIYEDLKGVLI